MTESTPVERALRALSMTTPENREQTGGNHFAPVPSNDFAPVTSRDSRGSYWPAKLGDDAYQGLAGEVVRAIEPHTEADPAAVLASLLVMFGNAIGRAPYFMAGDAQHPTNLFVCIVGATSSARKGTSSEAVERMLRQADSSWRTSSGLVSGEGIIHHVRDPRTTVITENGDDEGDGGQRTVDAGAEDKRLMVKASEFAQVLQVVARQGNTLSPTLRELWDKGTAQTLAKNSPDRATGALVSVLAHITTHELRANLSSTEVANGFANRFLFIAAQRSKLLSRGGSVPTHVLDAYVPKLKAALRQARRLNEVDTTEAAWAIYEPKYKQLSSHPPTLLGHATSRAAPMVRRLALVYAMLDQRDRVDAEHMRAALELWRYSKQSAKAIWMDATGRKDADRILGELRAAGDAGLPRTDIRNIFGNSKPAPEIESALLLLEDAGLAKHSLKPTGGRPAEHWHATSYPDAGGAAGHGPTDNAETGLGS